jgi:hypothetical protein
MDYDIIVGTVNAFISNKSILLEIKAMLTS